MYPSRRKELPCVEQAKGKKRFTKLVALGAAIPYLC